MASNIKNKELAIKTFLDIGYHANLETGEVFNSKNKKITFKDKSGHILLTAIRNKKFLSVRAQYLIYYLKYGIIEDRLYHINGNTTDNRIDNIKKKILKNQMPLQGKKEIDIGNKKLLKVIKKNLNVTPGYNRIQDPHLKKTIVTDAFIKVIRLIDNGNLGVEFEKIKGYIFIITKNCFLQHMNTLNKERGYINDNGDINKYDLTDDIDSIDEMISAILDDLLKKNYIWYLLIKLKLENKTINEIIKELNTTLAFVDLERKKCYKYIRDNIDKFK